MIVWLLMSLDFSEINLLSTMLLLLIGWMDKTTKLRPKVGTNLHLFHLVFVRCGVSWIMCFTRTAAVFKTQLSYSCEISDEIESFSLVWGCSSCHIAVNVERPYAQHIPDGSVTEKTSCQANITGNDRHDWGWWIVYYLPAVKQQTSICSYSSFKQCFHVS